MDAEMPWERYEVGRQMLLQHCLRLLDSPISPFSLKRSTCSVFFKGHSSMLRGCTLTSPCHGENSRSQRKFKTSISARDDRRPRTIVHKDLRAHSGQELTPNFW